MPGGLTQVLPAASLLAALGVSPRVASVRGLTQQTRDDVVPFGAFSKSDCRSRLTIQLATRKGMVAMMIIGVDPPKSTHGDSSRPADEPDVPPHRSHLAD